ncbi:hypothetical protein D9758_006061 [Tetrapyrgos nigripes]|uniref:non-specific serine/threonine protein kinase n=1 Tax=Tetrapyrgos nigripes TaxID=182062 RepID=A0A8H5D856_9AGAR|nr:hypothetical protein D9758_006061 [Tetrapyrgos nigripes]
MSPAQYRQYPSFSSNPSSSTCHDSYPCRRIDLADLDFLKLISGGGSGKVFLVRDRVQMQYLALKVMPKRRELNTVSNVLNERKTHSALSLEDNRYFLPLVASWHDEVNYYIATEYLPGGDLALHLAKHRIFSEQRAKFYVCEIILALEELHAHKIIHRDLKPSNIMLKADGHIVLGDFGISRHFESRDPSAAFERDSMDSAICLPHKRFDAASYLTSDDCGTTYYMAPEQHLCMKYSFEVDYWALGVILYRMLTGLMPFGQTSSSKHEIACSVIHDELRFPNTVFISPEAQDFIRGLLVKDPGERIHFSEIKNDPFFDGVNWAAVSRCQLPSSWRPYIPPNPRHPHTVLPFEYGTPFDYHSDPLPSFTWYRPSDLRKRRDMASLPSEYTPHPCKDITSIGKLMRPLKQGLGTLFGTGKGQTRQKRG